MKRVMVTLEIYGDDEEAALKLFRDEHNLYVGANAWIGGDHRHHYKVLAIGAEDPVQAVVDLWNRDGGWIPGAAWQQLAEALGVEDDRLVHLDKEAGHHVGPRDHPRHHAGMAVIDGGLSHGQCIIRYKDDAGEWTRCSEVVRYR